MLLKGVCGFSGKPGFKTLMDDAAVLLHVLLSSLPGHHDLDGTGEKTGCFLLLWYSGDLGLRRQHPSKKIWRYSGTWVILESWLELVPMPAPCLQKCFWQVP